MKKVIKELKKLYEIILSALFPKRCADCQSKGNYLCLNCENKIYRNGIFDNKTIFSVTSYHTPVIQQLVWLLKYKKVREVAQIFARWLYEALLEELSEISLYREQAGKILIIPIPLSKKRLRERGFNQAEEIAKHLTEMDPKLFRLETKVFIKTKNTPTQVSVKNRNERLNNLKGAFNLINKKIIQGRTIILLDDVATTGATLTEAEKVLNRGKPRRIIKVTVAR